MKKVCLLLALFGSFAFAKDDVQELKKEIELLKKRLDELERRLKEAEAAKKEAKEYVQTQRPESADRNIQLRLKYSETLGVYSPFRQTAFLPDISLIVDTSAVGRSLNDDRYKQLTIPGFTYRNTDDTPNVNRGFNLNYAELYLYAPVDPYFDLYATIPFSEHGSELEEAYAVTRGLPGGLQVKLGKFRSSFGRLNSLHPHVWDFVDAPLVYRVFLGDDGLVEKGIQVNWLAPLPFYLLFGAEVLQGENQESFGTDGFQVGSFSVSSTRKPNLYVGFVKTSFDLGNLSVLTGLSLATGHARNASEGFAGRTRLYGFDLTAKYFIDSYRYLAFQTEYLYRDQKGQIYDGTNSTVQDVSKKQGGLYAQVVWRFDPRWRVGLRYDLIDKNSVTGMQTYKNLYAYYGMLEYNPTEFSRIRFQVGQNRAFFEGTNRKTVNEVILQFNFAIGAHGAHPF
ncbi:TonB-dependent receptor [Thermocrinis minervae]|uniref:Zinc-regulated TonB-dependent outer membrane receptor n=1 Tax=Thermocrinis minervae TaxID=381751 RepID=A0A1M6QQA6_9AQUI|nr:TonB-dependent receptor [Thermocrinis minervae]SHK22318.1 hypothetical protein SAMN05444391_0337 [Thermocrinis minervae]